MVIIIDYIIWNTNFVKQCYYTVYDELVKGNTLMDVFFFRNNFDHFILSKENSNWFTVVQMS